MSDKTYDVLIVGGGYAGLSTALAMCRTGASTAVFDDQTYRNKDADYMHKLVTWDHRHPSEFRDAARKEIGEGRYDTTTLVEQGVGIDEVWRISDKPTMFGLKDTTGKIWKGRKLVLATGAQPVIPDVPGFRDCYPKSIWFCLFCKGIESRDLGNPQSTAGVLMTDNTMQDPAMGPMLGHHFAVFSKRHINNVTLYTHGHEGITKAMQDKFAYLQHLPEAERWVTVEPRRIVKLEPIPDSVNVKVHLEGGDVHTQGFLTHFSKNDAGTKFTVNEAAKEPLVVKAADGSEKTFPHYRVTKSTQPEGKPLKLEMAANYARFMINEPFNESTSEPGVFFPGDSGNGFKTATLAISGGTQAASGIIMSLMDEDEQVNIARAEAAKAQAGSST